MLLGIINFEFWYCKTITFQPLTPVLSTILGPVKQIPGDNTVYAIVYMAALLSGVYVSGHIVSSVSSFFIDRIYVAKAQGYPYETLLLLPRSSGFRKPDSKGFYQGVFFWLNFYLILRFLGFFFTAWELNTALHATELILAVAAFAKLGGSLLRGQSSSSLYRWLTKPIPKRWFVEPVKFFLTKAFPLPFASCLD